MPRKPKPVEEHKIDYGTAKSHYLNILFKAGKPHVSASDIKKGTSSYNEIIKIQQTLKEKDFILLLAELADISPTHWQMMAKYYEKRGYEYKPAGEVLKDAMAFYKVASVVQETKELSPAPISVVVKKTKKQIKQINKNFINALDDILGDIYGKKQQMSDRYDEIENYIIEHQDNPQKRKELEKLLEEQEDIFYKLYAN